MKIVKRIFLVFMLLFSSMCIISCGGGGGSDDDPDPYVKFSGEGYGDNEWLEGFSNYAEGVPAGSRFPGYGINCFIALKTTTTSESFNESSMDHVCILLNGTNVGNYFGGMCAIYMRVSGKEGNDEFELNKAVTVVTKVTGSYIKGTFTGETPSGKVAIAGSFVFKKMSDDPWPLDYPLYP